MSEICIRCSTAHNGRIKLPILHGDDRCIAVAKPPGVSCRVGPISILHQLCESLHKPCVRDLGFECPDIVYDLEDDVSGIVVLAKNREVAKILKNAYGSYQFDFTFDLICAKSNCDRGGELVCSLPIAQHASKEIMLISARTGKKSRTSFSFVESVGKYEHWQARCDYLRRDQICLHAHESGLAVLGDVAYGGAKIPSFAELKRNFKANKKEENEVPYAGIMAHLSTLKLHDGTVIRSELPKKMCTFLKLSMNS